LQQRKFPKQWQQKKCPPPKGVRASVAAWRNALRTVDKTRDRGYCDGSGGHFKPVIQIAEYLFVNKKCESSQ